MGTTAIFAGRTDSLPRATGSTRGTRSRLALGVPLSRQQPLSVGGAHPAWVAFNVSVNWVDRMLARIFLFVRQPP
jgi:hypothetical protein